MESRSSRRGFLAGTAALAAAAGSVVNVKNASAYPGFASEYIPHTKPFMDQYLDGAVKIVKGIRDTQIGAMAAAMRKAYELQSKGGQIVSDVSFGHFASCAGGKDRPGQPWVLPQLPIGTNDEFFDALKPGDFLITHVVSEGRKRAMERGVYVAGVTNNYYPFAETPPNGLREGHMALPRLEAMSNLVIDSQIPWYNGLVNAPQIPQFKICPGSGFAAYSVYWPCTALFATLIGSKGKDKSVQPAIDFLDLLIERLELIRTDRPKIDRVAQRMADYILANKPQFMVFGEKSRVSDTRECNMFVSDAVGSASGSMIGQQYNVDTIKKGDIVLIGSVRSRQADEMEVARISKSKGAWTIAFGPYSSDGDSSGERLYKTVDDAFNSYSPESEGVLSVKGFDKKICPTAGLTGLVVHWMLMAAWTDHMAMRGEMPYYWQGFHERGGSVYDNMVRPYFLKRGY